MKPARSELFDEALDLLVEDDHIESGILRPEGGFDFNGNVGTRQDALARASSAVYKLGRGALMRQARADPFPVQHRNRVFAMTLRRLGVFVEDLTPFFFAGFGIVLR